MLLSPSYQIDTTIQVNSDSLPILEAVRAFFATKISEITALPSTNSIDIQIWDHSISRSEIDSGQNIKTYFDEDTILLRSKEWIMRILVMNNVLLVKNDNNIQMTVQQYNPEAEVLILQVIRSVIEKTLFEKWYWVLHWWSFELDSDGYIILGEKWDWKTTILSQVLYQRNASFVSNDRVFFKYLGDGDLHLINREQHIRVWEQTALDIPPLERYIKNDGVKLDDDWKFYINELPYLIWAKAKNETFIRHIVLPNFTRKRNFFDLSPVEMIDQSKILDAKWFQLYNTLFGAGYTNNVLFWDEYTIPTFSPHIHKWNGVETLKDLISNL